MLMQACGDLITRVEKFATQINVTLTDTVDKVRTLNRTLGHGCPLINKYVWLHAQGRRKCL